MWKKKIPILPETSVTSSSLLLCAAVQQLGSLLVSLSEAHTPGRGFWFSITVPSSPPFWIPTDIFLEYKTGRWGDVRKRRHKVRSSSCVENMHKLQVNMEPNSDTSGSVQGHTWACKHTCTGTHSHALTCAHARSHTHTGSQTQAHRNTHSHALTHVHMCAHAHTHTHWQRGDSSSSLLH